MSEQDFWNSEWMDIQRRYWENWSELSRKAVDDERPQKSPWESAMDHWWEAVSPSAPDMVKEFMSRMMDGGWMITP